MLIRTIVYVYQWRKLSEKSEVLEDQKGNIIAKAENDFSYVIIDNSSSLSLNRSTLYYYKDQQTNKDLIEQTLINRGFSCIT